RQGRRRRLRRGSEGGSQLRAGPLLPRAEQAGSRRQEGREGRADEGLGARRERQLRRESEKRARRAEVVVALRVPSPLRLAGERDRFAPGTRDVVALAAPGTVSYNKASRIRSSSSRLEYATTISPFPSRSRTSQRVPSLRVRRDSRSFTAGVLVLGLAVEPLPDFAARTSASVWRTLRRPVATFSASAFRVCSSFAPRSARAWPSLSSPPMTSLRTFSGNLSSRSALATVERSLPTLSASVSCV